MKSYWVKDTDQKISARSLTVVIFAAVLAFCGHKSMTPLFFTMLIICQKSTLCQETPS